MKLPGVLYFTIINAIIITGLVWCTGCAQIGMPTGGSRDSIPPRLLKAVPELNSTGFTANKINRLDDFIWF